MVFGRFASTHIEMRRQCGHAFASLLLRRLQAFGAWSPETPGGLTLRSPGWNRRWNSSPDFRSCQPEFDGA